MYNNPYYGIYNPQTNIERINSQIAELEKLKAQVPNQQVQQPSISQTFQLASNNQGTMKYVNSIDEVNKELVIGEMPFFSKDMSLLWVKNSKGEVKSYELTEIVQKDQKDTEIENLRLEIEKLRKELKNNAEPDNDNAYEPIKDEVPPSIPTSRTSSKKSK